MIVFNYDHNKFLRVSILKKERKGKKRKYYIYTNRILIDFLKNSSETIYQLALSF